MVRMVIRRMVMMVVRKAIYGEEGHQLNCDDGGEEGDDGEEGHQVNGDDGDDGGEDGDDGEEGHQVNGGLA